MVVSRQKYIRSDVVHSGNRFMAWGQGVCDMDVGMPGIISFCIRAQAGSRQAVPPQTGCRWASEYTGQRIQASRISCESESGDF